MGVDIQKILNKLRIEQLNEMQQHAAEAILGSDGDVVLLSPTGSGKTLAYLLPLIQRLDSDSNEVQALVITPGRELALQSDNVLKSMGSGFRSVSCYGGRAAMDEHKVLKEVKPQIVFGTPAGSGFRVTRNFEKMDADAIAKEAVDEALFMLKAAPVPSGTYRAIIEAKCMPGMLGAFDGVFSAESAQKGLSLLAGKEGEMIASEAVTLMDDPLLPGGLASQPFDAEGVATRT